MVEGKKLKSEAVVLERIQEDTIPAHPPLLLLPGDVSIGTKPFTSPGSFGCSYNLQRELSGLVVSAALVGSQEK